jgi:hypothetical protein
VTDKKIAAIKARAYLRTEYILAFNDANPNIATPSLVYTNGWWVLDDRGTRSRFRTDTLRGMIYSLRALAGRAAV